MKRDLKNILTGLLLAMTAIVFGWAILLVTVGVTILEMFHTAAPSSPEYRNMLRDACADSQKLLWFAIIPMSVVMLLWLLAFLRLRKMNDHLRKQLRQS